MNPKQFTTTKAKATNRMNLLTFTLHTNRSLFFVAAVFIYGTIDLLVTGEHMAALAVFLFGTCIVLAYFLGAALHRHKLVRMALTAYVRKIIHNANEGLPKEQVAVDHVRFIFDSPIA